MLVDSAFAFDLPQVSAGWIDIVDVETGRTRTLSRRAFLKLARGRPASGRTDVRAVAKDLDLDVVTIGTRFGEERHRPGRVRRRTPSEKNVLMNGSSDPRCRLRRRWLASPSACLSPPTAFAQDAARPVEADPIRCWWRTSASSVRIGEPFSLVLTCAVLENDAVQVVPDEARLAPSVDSAGAVRDHRRARIPKTCEPPIAGSFSTTTACA